MKIPEIYYTQAEFCKVVSHPYRLLILETLSGAPRTVNEISKILNTSPSNISQHLKKLLDKGVVRREKKGNKMYYHLEYPEVLEASKIMRKVLEKIFKQRIKLLNKGNP